jgi:hypothetical protein
MDNERTRSEDSPKTALDPPFGSFKSLHFYPFLPIEVDIEDLEIGDDMNSSNKMNSVLEL